MLSSIRKREKLWKRLWRVLTLCSLSHIQRENRVSPSKLTCLRCVLCVGCSSILLFMCSRHNNVYVTGGIISDTMQAEAVRVMRWRKVNILVLCYVWRLKANQFPPDINTFLSTGAIPKCSSIVTVMCGMIILELPYRLLAGCLMLRHTTEEVTQRLSLLITASIEPDIYYFLLFSSSLSLSASLFSY